MICTENLRSAFTKDDVDEYLYKLLPERDAVVREMEDYAAEHGVPISDQPWRVLSLFVQVSGAKPISEMGSAIGYSTIWLARAAGPKSKVFLYGWRFGEGAPGTDVLPHGGRGQANRSPDWRRAGDSEEDAGHVRRDFPWI